MTRDVSVIVLRKHFFDSHTVGELKVNGQKVCDTLEYPWRGNTPWNDHMQKRKNVVRVSCAHEGVYRAHLRYDHHRKDGAVQWHLELEHVHGRSHIELHPGNTLAKDSEGCLLVGNVPRAPQPGGVQIGSSNDAMNTLVKTITGHDVVGVRDLPTLKTIVADVRIHVHVVGMPSNARGTK